MLAGEEAPLALAEVESLAGGDIEVELHHGGQAAYWWLLSAE